VKCLPDMAGRRKRSRPRTTFLVPFFVQRWIVYEPEGIKIMFVEAPTNNELPVTEWNIFLFVDERRNVVLTAEIAFKRLSARRHELERRMSENGIWSGSRKTWAFC
jgi:hypothetical protein